MSSRLVYPRALHSLMHRKLFWFKLQLRSARVQQDKIKLYTRRKNYTKKQLKKTAGARIKSVTVTGTIIFCSFSFLLCFLMSSFDVCFFVALVNFAKIDREETQNLGEKPLLSLLLKLVQLIQQGNWKQFSYISSIIFFFIFSFFSNFCFFLFLLKISFVFFFIFLCVHGRKTLSRNFTSWDGPRHSSHSSSVILEVLFS